MTGSEKRDHFGGFFKIELLVLGNAVGIKCPNSTQDNTNDVSGGSDVGM